MSAQAKYLFIAAMDVDPDKEALFNEVYENEHIPLLLKVPGVLSIKRYATMPLTMVLGGETRTIVAEGEPRYSAVYEIESPDVLTSAAWANAVDAGRWPGASSHEAVENRELLRRMKLRVLEFAK